MRTQCSDTAYKASHLCTYSYFPQYLGTSRDGINAMSPVGQASEFYDGLKSDVKECFDAYGVKTYVEMLGTRLLVTGILCGVILITLLLKQMAEWHGQRLVK